MSPGEPAPHEYRVLDSESVFEGRVIALRRDTVTMPGGGDSVREVVTHPGAVAVVALDDETVVLPGHGPATTIGRERATNPYLAEAAAGAGPAPKGRGL